MLTNEMALNTAVEDYMKHLELNGKKPRTLYTYGKDCEQIIAFFGQEKLLKNILPVHVAAFYKSDALLKIPKNGKQRQPETVRKTKRVFRMLLTWAKEQGFIESVPLPREPITK
jgi:hypothetical protein